MGRIAESNLIRIPDPVEMQGAKLKSAITALSSNLKLLNIHGWNG